MRPPPHSAITVSIHSTRIHEMQRQYQHQRAEKHAYAEVQHDSAISFM